MCLFEDNLDCTQRGYIRESQDNQKDGGGYTKETKPTRTVRVFIIENAIVDDWRFVFCELYEVLRDQKENQRVLVKL